jgi:ubiquinone/menaquinone biosynthesis C-methylase UbiE
MKTETQNRKGTIPFDNNCNEYDLWFDQNTTLYESELAALKALMPQFSNAIEIGIGTGRFALPFSIKLGVEPSENMAKIAIEKGITVIKAFAEQLPFHDKTFDLVLINTALCFVENVDKSLSEVHRILKQNGILLIGMIDKNSPIGKQYEQGKENDKFFSYANFLSAEQLIGKLKHQGFNSFEFSQTIFPNQVESNQIQLPKSGFGEGCYLVIKSKK